MDLNSADNGNQITLLPPIFTSAINGYHLATKVDVSVADADLATRAKRQWGNSDSARSAHLSLTQRTVWGISAAGLQL